MFTGIVEAQGTIVAVAVESARARITVATPGWGPQLIPGESIAVNGVCLTVASIDGDTWDADVMHITRETTTLGEVEAGQRVNLERAMRPDGRLGGHILQGHVDGVATLVSRDSQPEWEDLVFEIPRDLARYVAPKGSIGLHGTSLTVAVLEDGAEHSRVTVSLIPTTLRETTFGEATVGTKVNVEVDILAKYVERLLGERA